MSTVAYAVVAYVNRKTVDGYDSLKRLPTFYLHADVQGIVSADHAARIAVEMLTDAAGPDATVHVAVSSADETAVAGS